MKKLIAAAVSAALVACILLSACCVLWLIDQECQARKAQYDAGFAEGVRHAIEDSEIWTVDVYTPGHPELSEWNGYDQLIYITLDGETYEHGMYQG